SDGVLTLTIPVAEEARPRKITVSHTSSNRGTEGVESTSTDEAAGIEGWSAPVPPETRRAAPVIGCGPPAVTGGCRRGARPAGPRPVAAGRPRRAAAGHSRSAAFEEIGQAHVRQLDRIGDRALIAEVLTQIRLHTVPGSLIRPEPVRTGPGEIDDAVDIECRGELDDAVVGQSQTRTRPRSVVRPVDIAGVHDAAQPQ